MTVQRLPIPGVTDWYRYVDDVTGTEVARGYEPPQSPEQSNRADLVNKAQQALTANATYLALASPSTAQNTAQIQRLTREASALIRLLTEAFDTTAGT